MRPGRHSLGRRKIEGRQGGDGVHGDMERGNGLGGVFLSVAGLRPAMIQAFTTPGLPSSTRKLASV